MDGKLLQTHFGRIGARALVREDAPGDSVRLDIRADRRGQYFDVLTPGDADAKVLDADRSLRHLLLMSVDGRGEKRRFLCGHDEREWFVAAVPGRSITRVRDAMEALKPQPVLALQARVGLKAGERLRRHTAAYIRQGEWFFLPGSPVAIRDWMVLRNEPLSRGPGSKPHMVDLLYREGGQTVFVARQLNRVLTPEEYSQFLRDRPEAKSWSWATRRVNPTVFVRGRVRHPDHATVHLSGWHQVVMNTEAEAPGARQVMFLD